VKKIALVVVSAFCLLIFAACGNEDGPGMIPAAHREAYALLLEMNDAVAGVTSLAASVEVDFSVTGNSDPIQVSMYSTIQQIIRDESEIELARISIIDMGRHGVMNSRAFFINGYLYQDVIGTLFRTPMSADRVREMISIEAGAPLTFPIEAITTSLIVVQDSGNRQITFTLNGEMINDMLSDMVGDMVSGLDIGGAAISFGDVSYTVVLGEDNLAVSQRTVFDMYIDFDEERFSARYDMRLTDIFYDELMHITFPSNLHEFPLLLFD